jgi:hypothetical protein
MSGVVCHGWSFMGGVCVRVSWCVIRDGVSLWGVRVGVSGVVFQGWCVKGDVLGVVSQGWCVRGDVKGQVHVRGRCRVKLRVRGVCVGGGMSR